MAEKNLKARIVHKHDIEANWLLATNFTPMKGEIIIYDIDGNYSYERIKIGDGVQNVNQLPFATNRSLKVTILRDANGNNVIDKTYKEIYDAASVGAHVYMVTGNTIYVDGYSMWPDTILWLSYCSDYSVMFTHNDASSEFEVEVDTDNEVSLYYGSSLPSRYSYGFEGMVLTVGQDGAVTPADFPDTIARTSDVEEVKTLVGDTSVSEQIEVAIADIPGQVQPDWSVNETDNPAYVNNRPFYENATTTTILSDTTFEFSDYGSYCAVEDGLNITLTEGTEYQIKIDDAIYTSVCGTFDGGLPYLGNLHVFNNALEDTGESFVFFMEGTYFLCGTTEFDAGNHIIAISQVAREIHTLDEKFIPDTIARVADIEAQKKELIIASSTEGSTKQFKITIDDTGTLTVTEVE